MNTSALPLKLSHRGKVRDVYEVDPNTLLLVATDRVSAFDVIMREAVPYKGAVLTQITAWWLSQLKGIKHHMISANIDEIVDHVPELRPYRKELAGRSMLSIRAKVYPIECVVRAYISGSGWKEYLANGTLAYVPLPPGMRQSERLSAPMFTPAIKAESGHDENISRERAAEILGPVAQELERLSMEIFEFGRSVVERAGILLADTKFEFGERRGEIILIDEVMTPDSSRFWAAESYQPGTIPPSFDKQPLRDYLEGERKAGRWNGDAPAPPLPESVVAATSARYLDAYQRITGQPLDTAGLA